MLRKAVFTFLYFAESYVFVSAIALLAGLVFSSALSPWGWLATPLLQLIFFISSLTIDFTQLKQSLRSWLSILIVNVFMLIILPVVVYYGVAFVFPELALPLMLLAAMPAGLTTPLLTGLINGSKELSVVLTVTTSLLAPLTIPIVVTVLVGQTVAIDTYAMFFQLFQIIVLPFILGALLQKFFKKGIALVEPSFKSISLISLGALIAVIIAPLAPVILQEPSQMLRYLVIMIVFYFLLHFAGYILVPWKKHRERLTIMVSIVYSSFVLALVIADTYFNQPEVIIPLVVQVAPWALMLIPFNTLLKKIRS